MHAIKSLSYAPNMLAVRIAREQGAEDALFVTADGRVLEASCASFFYVLGDTLYTPPLDGVLGFDHTPAPIGGGRRARADDRAR